ncbi:hypothetical protein AJ79_09701 [Helicocarpus griseus UAMH5409]|uniref:Ras-GEF domain-containing protein n=1 Tax=Helicocarpus griseus UAMH5409 TaxID=1447875 RepID=A0A2B7WI55_9EURO|nr:hypothetical protein AJ79_09701 [Helicocarpus griseus UAMH5409]
MDTSNSTYLIPWLEKRSEEIARIQLPIGPNPLLGVDIRDVSAIVRAIDNSSWSLFQHIPFAAWVLKALGEEEDLIDSFLFHHDILAFRLYCRLQRCCSKEKEGIKSQLLEAASDMGGFTRSVISGGICGNNGACIDIGFIINPLARLFARPIDGSLDNIIGILEVRYQCKYHLQRDFNTAFEFRTDTSFFHALTTVSLADFAISITHRDSRSFEDYILLAKDFNRLNLCWNDRCEEVMESLQVRPELLAMLLELALRLYELRNFYALTAIVHGVDKAGHRVAIPSELRHIVLSKNYQNYRNELQNGPALPFLFPALVDLESGTQARAQYGLETAEYEACRRKIICSLREVFAFMSYKPEVLEITSCAPEAQGAGIAERVRGALESFCCI